jgi:hypothetical protein
MFGARKICPTCKGTLDYSRIRWYDRFRRRLTGQRPYRCYTCRRRCWL